jgi:hypothetical protein
MRILVKPILVCVCLAVANGVLAGSERPASKRDALDGARFKGVTGEQGKGEDHEDTISFDDGLFRSLDCEGWGFGAAPYRVEKVGDSYHFSATLPSADRGTLEWQGVIAGDAARATFRWRHERWYWDIDRKYWFRGTRSSGE